MTHLTLAVDSELGRPPLDETHRGDAETRFAGAAALRWTHDGLSPTLN